MKCIPGEKEEYKKSLLKKENDIEDEKLNNMSSENSVAIKDDADLRTDNTNEDTEIYHDKKSDGIFLDATKSKSDCIVLDMAPSTVNKLTCVVFDGSLTTIDPSQIDSNTSIKPYLDSISLSEPYCRVCHCSGEEKLISPCYCSGSVKWVHETCLVKWMKSSFKESCELCRKNIEIAKRRKPLSKWKLPSQRPTPVLWVLVFITAIALNLASVVKDASRQCSSTPCIVFYAVGCIGVVLGTLFLIYWSKRAKHFVNHWLEQNEEWVVLLENTDKQDRNHSASSDNNTINVRT